MNNKRTRIRCIGKMCISRLPLPRTSSTLASLRLMSTITTDCTLYLRLEEFRTLNWISDADEGIVARVVANVAPAGFGADTVGVSWLTTVKTEGDGSGVGFLRID